MLEGLSRKCKKCGSKFEGKGCKNCKNARGRERYHENLEAERARGAKYRKENVERINAKGAAYRAANRSACNARTKACEALNKDKVKIRTAKWYDANKERKRVSVLNRQARIKCAGKLSRNLISNLVKLQKGKCACCKRILGDDYHLDHIMPIHLGGLNVDSNMQLLRAECNLEKHAKHPVVFMQERGYLL